MSDDNIIDLNCWTTHDIDPDKILENNKGNFERVAIIGTCKKTGDLVICSSVADIAKVYIDLEIAKERLLEMSK